MIQPDTAAQLDVRFFNQRSKSGTFRIRRTIIHSNPTDFSICSKLSLAECCANFRGDTIPAGLRVQEAILTTNYCKTRHPSSIVNTAKVQESQYRNLPSNTESLHLPKQMFHRRLIKSCFRCCNDIALKIDFLPLKVTSRLYNQTLCQLSEPHIPEIVRRTHTQHRDEVSERRGGVISQASQEQTHVYNVVRFMQISRQISQYIQSADRATRGQQLGRWALFQTNVESVNRQRLVKCCISEPDTDGLYVSSTASWPRS